MRPVKRSLAGMVCVAIVSAATVLIFALNNTGRSQAKEAAPGYEYKVVSGAKEPNPQHSDPGMEERLTATAKDGWKLVHVLSVGGTAYTAVFERPAQVKEASRYEYKVVSGAKEPNPQWSDPGMQGKITAAAKDGWRLVHVLPVGGTAYTAVFERPAQ